jgi:N-acetylglucosamine kinase-like BadF-type ATPase
MVKRMVTRHFERWVIGVDAGGTKTVAWLCRVVPVDGVDPGRMSVELWGRGVGGAANLVSSGVQSGANAIREAIDGALDSARSGSDMIPSVHSLPVTTLWVGAAGASQPERASRLTAILGGLYAIPRITVRTDVDLLLAAARCFPDSDDSCLPNWIGHRYFGRFHHSGATAGLPGRRSSPVRPMLVLPPPRPLAVMALIVGTGSVVWGSLPSGEFNRWGGHGHDGVGDIGSGCWLGKTATLAALAAIDRPDVLTEFKADLLAITDCASLSDLARKIQSSPPSPGEWAALAPSVCRSAVLDPHASRIVSTGLQGLGDLTKKAAAWMNGYAPWVLIAAGGLITHQPHWLEQLYPANIEQTESLPAYLLHEPVWGAICRAVHPED